MAKLLRALSPILFAVLMAAMISCGGSSIEMNSLTLTGIASVEVGKTAAFVAEYNDQNVTSQAAWSTDGGTVSQEGIFSSSETGTFGVRVTYNNLSASATINVVEPTNDVDYQIVGAIAGFRADPVTGDLLRNARITNYTGDKKYEMGIGDSQSRGLEHVEVEYWDVTANAWKFREITDSLKANGERFVHWDWETGGRSWRGILNNDFVATLLGSDLIGIPDPDGDNCHQTIGTVWVNDSDMGELYAYLNPGIQRAEEIVEDMTVVTVNTATETIIKKKSRPWLIPTFGAGAILGQMLAVSPAICPIVQFPETHCYKTVVTPPPPPVNEPPVAWLSADPNSGVTTSLTVNLDAGASTDSDGTIVKYEFDFEGNGVWLDAGTDSSVLHVYTTVGSRTPRVRVTDDDGATNIASASTAVVVTSPQVNPYEGATLWIDPQDSFADAYVGDEVTLMARIYASDGLTELDFPSDGELAWTSDPDGFIEGVADHKAVFYSALALSGDTLLYDQVAIQCSLTSSISGPMSTSTTVFFVQKGGSWLGQILGQKTKYRMLIR